MTWALLAVFYFCLLAKGGLGCIELELTSESLGTVRFKQVKSLPIIKPGLNETYLSSGRAVYVASREEADSASPDIYLYHTLSDEVSGVGRWVINEDFGSSEAAMAYINSWAVSPILTDEVADSNDASSWMIPSASADGESESENTTRGWVLDKTFELYCIDEDDDIVYFETSSILQPTLAGFYVRTLQTPPSSSYTGPLYAQIKISTQDKQMYMFRLSDGVWMIGDEPGVDAGLAFAEDSALSATHIKSSAWKFISGSPNSEGNPEWIVDESAIILATVVEYPDDSETAAEGATKEQTFSNVYEALRFSRSLKYVPIGQQYYTLRNALPMPQIGLGTGGLLTEETKNIVKLAMKVGFRSFDLAREYKNENIIGELITESLEDDTMPVRGELFLETKVWPTELGFFPTTDAVMTSLEELKTNYVDLYLLHWPECNKEIDWMHCEDTKDPEATWNESWRALEKAYAEGRVMSIGVSNFNVTLLDEVTSFSSIRPHVVQNWAEPGHVDDDVRMWCFRNDAVYQPYASVRNLHTMSEEMAQSLATIAQTKKKSTHATALRFFLQTGAAIIPRSSSEEHLRENIDIFNMEELSAEEMKTLGWHLDLEGGEGGEEDHDGDEEGDGEEVEEEGEEL